MTTKTELERFKLDDINFAKNPHTIRVLCNEQEYVLTSDKTIETHDPMDRVGGPFCIHRLCEEGADNSGDRWFLFWIADSYFPPCILVRGDNEEDAYQNFIDWLGDKDANDGEGHYGMIVTDAEKLAQLETDEGLDGVDYTSYGVPVDTSDVRMRECTIKALEF